MQLDVSIIIINYKTPELTITATESVIRSIGDKLNYEIIIIDNCSKDGSIEKLTRIKKENISIIETEYNGGFGYGNNIGASQAKGKYLFFLNSDTIMYPSILKKMIDYISISPQTGILSCHMIDGDGIPLVTGHAFENVYTLFIQTVIKPFIPQFIKSFRGNLSHRKSKEQTTTYDWVSGAALLISKKLFNEVGGWSKDYFMYMEDEELCKRVNDSGYKIELYNEIGLIHLVGKSGGSEFVAVEKYKSGITFFKNHRHKQMLFIKILLLIQAWFYVKNITLRKKLSFIIKLRQFK